MVIPDDIATWLKIVGALSTAIGSILLAWRVKVIIKWVVHCLVAHEESLVQIRRVLAHEPQKEPLVEGVTKHLLQIERKLGVFLLVSGFVLLALGMLASAASFFFASGSVSA
jgi:hypothetical protein